MTTSASERDPYRMHENVERWLSGVAGCLARLEEDSHHQKQEDNHNPPRQRRRGGATAAAAVSVGQPVPSTPPQKHRLDEGAAYKAAESTKSKEAISSSGTNFRLLINTDCHLHRSKRCRPNLTNSKATKDSIEPENVLFNHAAPHTIKAAAPSPASGKAFKEAYANRTQILEHRCTSGKQYDKKPRHKTKADKYDVKVISKLPGLKKGDVVKKNSNKRRRRKSGFILNKEFKAPNVAQDRLTLNANDGLGMFRKGRASSPVRRSGLPDRSFSEMNFLSRRQNHDEMQQQVSKENYTENKKDKVVAQHVSAYFECRPAAKPEEHHLSAPVLPGQTGAYKQIAFSECSSSNKQRTKEPQEADPNLALRCRHSSPRNDNAPPVAQICWALGIGQPRDDHHSSRSTPTDQRQQVNGLSSRYRWSPTPSQRSDSPKLAGNVCVNAGQASYRHDHDLDGHRVQPHTKGTKIQREDQSVSDPAPKSSSTALSVDKDTTSMLLGFKTGSPDDFRTQRAAAELYTLADLKNLSHLDRLEVNQKETGSSCHKPAANSHFAEANLSGLDVTPGQGKFKHQTQPVPRSLLRTAEIGRSKHSFQPAAKAGSCTDPSIVQDLHLFPTESRRELVPANFLGFERGQSDNPSTTVPGGTVMQPVLWRHPHKNTRGQRKYSPSKKNNVQQIISDIEREEVLGNRSSKYGDSLFDNIADIAVQSLHGPLSQQEVFDGYSLSPDYDTLLPQMHAPSFDQAQGDQHQPRSPADPNYTDRGCANAQTGGAAAHLQDPCQLGPAFCRTRLTKQQGQQKKEEESRFVDFWRPNILY